MIYIYVINEYIIFEFTIPLQLQKWLKLKNKYGQRVAGVESGRYSSSVIDDFWNFGGKFILNWLRETSKSVAHKSNFSMI